MALSETPHKVPPKYVRVECGLDQLDRYLATHEMDRPINLEMDG